MHIKRGLSSVGCIRALFAFRARDYRGFTVLEVAVVIAILGTLAAITVPSYQRSLDRARIARATSDIRAIQQEIATFEAVNKVLPASLGDLGRSDFHDPWGNLYMYYRFPANSEGDGKKRKDKFMVPLNSAYDLYSYGEDGVSDPPLTSTASHDDIIRASDGTYVGIATGF